MTFQNHSTGEEFEDEGDYLRSLKRDDSYLFSYQHEYIAERFGDGDDDVTLETAELSVWLFWDDSDEPGYVVECSLDSPTQVPVELNGDIDEIFNLHRSEITSDAAAYGVGPELFKNWPL